MQGEPTIQDIFEIVLFLKDNMATQDDIAAIRAEMGTKEDLRLAIEGVRSEMATKQDLQSEIQGLRGEMKQGFAEVYTRMATKDDIAWLDEKITRVRRDLSCDMQELRDDMMAHIDGFIGLYKTQEQELAALSVRTERLEKFRN